MKTFKIKFRSKGRLFKKKLNVISFGMAEGSDKMIFLLKNDICYEVPEWSAQEVWISKENLEMNTARNKERRPQELERQG